MLRPHAALHHLATPSLLALVTLATWAPVALAGGFMVSKIGGDTAGVTEASPSSLFWNPAALGRVRGTTLYLDNNVIWRLHHYERDLVGEAAGGGREPRQTHAHFDPQPMLALTSDLGSERLTLGVGGYVPFGSTSVNASDGPERWHSIWGGIIGGFLSASLTYALTDELWVGASGSYVLASVRSYRAVDFAPFVEERAGTRIAPEQVEHEGRAYLDFSGSGAAASLGVLWAPGPFSLGASWTSAVRLRLNGSFEIYLPRSSFYQEVIGDDIRSPATFRATWPQALRVGGSWQASARWSYRLSGEWVQWSQYDRITIRARQSDSTLGDVDQVLVTGWQDTWGVRAGTRARISESWQAFGGAGWESSAIPPRELGPDNFDAHKFGLAGGVIVDLSERLRLTTGYTHVLYLPVEVRTSNRAPSAAGSHRQSAGLLNTNLTLRFGPGTP